MRKFEIAHNTTLAHQQPTGSALEARPQEAKPADLRPTDAHAEQESD